MRTSISAHMSAFDGGADVKVAQLKVGGVYTSFKSGSTEIDLFFDDKQEAILYIANLLAKIEAL